MIRRFFKRDRSPVRAEETPHGLFLFDVVNEAIAAEQALKRSGFAPQLVSPPANLRVGCDLAISIPRGDYADANRLLAESNVPVRDWLVDDEGSADLIDSVTTVDFGRWIMVKAGNMKIVVDVETTEIVNTSGGGCPDIPYLNLELVGMRLDEAPRPRTLGYTLCGLMLDRAFVEACRILKVKV